MEKNEELTTAEEVAVQEENETIVADEVETSEEALQEEVTEDELEENDQVTSLQSEIEKLKEELQENENKYYRVLADYDNLKRRSTLDKEALQKYKSQSVLTSIIPVLDNFERALSVEAETEEAKSMMEGMDMIYRSLLDSLKAEGLVVIEAQDKPFDPNFHQAVMTGAEEDKESGIVLDEMQKGYMLKDRVLRPSMVKVND